MPGADIGPREPFFTMEPQLLFRQQRRLSHAFAVITMQGYLLSEFSVVSDRSVRECRRSGERNHVHMITV